MNFWLACAAPLQIQETIEDGYRVSTFTKGNRKSVLREDHCEDLRDCCGLDAAVEMAHIVKADLEIKEFGSWPEPNVLYCRLKHKELLKICSIVHAYRHKLPTPQ